ncbi:hypothetical protein [Halococcoides cellulosivorans]|uniref:Uncharacterized protein n=1 Tax=Halococcoides cellulosivorans TaxID=1679096 RepID=A0A2R4WYW0_9EURY|nr:hypothetical protein [Halococcoides cellulosivorans]AWB26728.1 hypothetical protein HARCEL1_02860 [Halococcoides cellulosivorans]
MAAGLAKKGARGGKRVGSKASSTLGSGDSAFMGGMTGGFLASDDDGTQSFSSNTGMDDSITDAPEPVSAVGATGAADDGSRREYTTPFDTEDRDVERVTQTRDTGADHDIDPMYTNLADGDRALAARFQAQDQNAAAMRREIGGLTDDGSGGTLTEGAAKEVVKTLAGTGATALIGTLLGPGAIGTAAAAGGGAFVGYAGQKAVGRYGGTVARAMPDSVREGFHDRAVSAKAWYETQEVSFSAAYQKGRDYVLNSGDSGPSTATKGTDNSQFEN